MGIALLHRGGDLIYHSFQQILHRRGIPLPPISGLDTACIEGAGHSSVAGDTLGACGSQGKEKKRRPRKATLLDPWAAAGEGVQRFGEAGGEFLAICQHFLRQHLRGNGVFMDGRLDVLWVNQ